MIIERPTSENRCQQSAVDPFYTPLHTRRSEARSLSRYSNRQASRSRQSTTVTMRPDAVKAVGSAGVLHSGAGSTHANPSLSW